MFILAVHAMYIFRQESVYPNDLISGALQRVEEGRIAKIDIFAFHMDLEQKPTDVTPPKEHK